MAYDGSITIRTRVESNYTQPELDAFLDSYKGKLCTQENRN